MSKYGGKMDKQCIALCDAINHIDGLETSESCCGHGHSEFRIWFAVKKLDHLPVLLYFLDPCHVGFRWHCKVYTDCGMSPARFYIESESRGPKAYKEAIRIATEICVHLRLDESDIPTECVREIKKNPRRYRVKE